MVASPKGSSRKPSKDVISIDPELERLIPSSDPDVELQSIAAAPVLEINGDGGANAEIEGIEESPTRPSRGNSNKRKEPLYKAIVVEDNPGGWGLRWGDDGDDLTYHGWGEERPQGWKSNDEEDHHGWKHDMDHHHVSDNDE